MAYLDLSNKFTVLSPPPWKKRDLTVWGLFFCPLNMLVTDTPQWVSITRCLYKSAATIKSLSMLIIESSKKLAIDKSTSGQFARAEYRMWQIYRLEKLLYSFSDDTMLYIGAAKVAFAVIKRHFYFPSPSPFEMDEFQTEVLVRPANGWNPLDL